MTKEEKILQFLINNKSKLCPSDMEALENKLYIADERVVNKCLWTNLKNPWITFILNFFLANLGGGYWYLGSYGEAIIAIVAFAIFAVLSIILYLIPIVPILIIIILWIVMLCLSFRETYDRNYDLITDLLK